MATFTCGRCGKERFTLADGVTTGYGEIDGVKHCYDCCADVDREFMQEHGRIALYLTVKKCGPHGTSRLPDRHVTGEVTNWPQTLIFKVRGHIGCHNIARRRYDVWFTGPDGFKWHGVTYGDNTQICHCKRTKVRVSGQGDEGQDRKSYSDDQDRKSYRVTA